MHCKMRSIMQIALGNPPRPPFARGELNSFPSSISRRYTRVWENRKSRHFGRDADKFVRNEFGRAKRGAKPEPHGCGEPIQAMDGNKSIEQMLDSGNMPTRSFMFAVAGTSVVAPCLPSLDAGFRHPCRNDGVIFIVSSTVGRATSQSLPDIRTSGATQKYAPDLQDLKLRRECKACLACTPQRKAVLALLHHF